MYAKHYENLTMLSKVTAKNVGDVFLRHTVFYLALHVSICCIVSLDMEDVDVHDDTLL